MATTSTAFGWLRFATGLGIGSLVATTAALVSEYAPAGKKNLINAITNWRHPARAACWPPCWPSC